MIAKLFAVSMLLYSPLAWSVEWKLIDDSDGIQVYSSSVQGSDHVAFRGVKIMPVPIDRVGFVLLDTNVENKKLWIDLIRDYQILEKTPDFSISYSSFDLPWPVSNRDFIVETHYTIDPIKKELVMDLKSTTHPQAPPTIGVRGEVKHSRYVLTVVDATHTRVELEIHSDPKGLLPSWLINLLQKSWPYNTLTMMEKQTYHPSTQPLPSLTPLLL